MKKCLTALRAQTEKQIKGLKRNKNFMTKVILPKILLK